jgi:hypothetical protein
MTPISTTTCTTIDSSTTQCVTAASTTASGAPAVLWTYSAGDLMLSFWLVLIFSVLFFKETKFV